MDDVFDSFFESIFEDMMQEQLNSEIKLDKMTEDIDKRIKDNEGHITLTGIKDLKKEEDLTVTTENQQTQKASEYSEQKPHQTY